MPRAATWLEPLDAREAELVARFQDHPVIAGVARLTREQLLELLLQRRFLSLAFTPLYDLAVDAFDDRETKDCLREILREEYPANDQPTHREDLVADLIALGATWEMVVESAATSATVETIGRLVQALRKVEARTLYQVKVLSFMRLAGEVLVAVEYQRLWPSLETFGLRGERSRTALAPEASRVASRFYYPHLRHDGGTFRLSDDNDELPPMSHSDRLTELLRQRLRATGPSGVESALQAMERAISIKVAFYDQFEPWLL